MGRYVRLEQIEEGLVLKSELEKIRKELDDMKDLGFVGKKPHMDKIRVTDQNGYQNQFRLSLVPSEDEVTLNYNGVDYFEGEGFRIDRPNRWLTWEGGPVLKPTLTSTTLVSTLAFNSYGGMSVVSLISTVTLNSTMSLTNLRVKYLTEDAYDGMLDPECVGKYEDEMALVQGPELDTERITNMKDMFKNCANLTSIPAYNTSNVTDMSGMFSGCSSLTTIPQLDTSRVGYMSDMFSGCSSMTTTPSLNYSRALYLDGMFSGCSSLTTANNLSFMHNAVDMSGMFSGCSSLTTGPSLNTSSVKRMGRWPEIRSNAKNGRWERKDHGMFSNCGKLTSIPQYDTSEVLDMCSMFSGCSALTTIPRLNTEKVINMSGMFSGCSSLTVVPQLDTKNVFYFGYAQIYNYASGRHIVQGMFSDCTSLTTIPPLDMSKAENTMFMFSNCSSLISLPKMNLSTVKSAGDMFKGCISLKNISFVENSIRADLCFSDSPQLTKVSLLSILHGLDGKVVKGSYYNSMRPYNEHVYINKTLTLHPTSKALLSSNELAIATNKGWTVN